MPFLRYYSGDRYTGVSMNCHSTIMVCLVPRPEILQHTAEKGMRVRRSSVDEFLPL
jgi:hypothetical protein